MKSILDPTFRYTKAVDTDIRKTFERIRREQATAKARADLATANLEATVAVLHKHRRQQ